MIPCILLSGYLNEARLSQAFTELNRTWALKERFLVIESNGGDIIPALDFVRKVREIDFQGCFGVKIYQAASAAAFVALSLGDHREIKYDSSLELHRGRLQLEAADFLHDGRVPETFLGPFQAYTCALDDLVERKGLVDIMLLGEFHGTGWLKLSAEQCLEFGLVQVIF